MGRHLNRRHPVSGELFTDLRARACAMRAEHTPIRRIAEALGVSRSCVHRWVLDMPEHEAASAKNGGVRIYPAGSRWFANKLRRNGYPREQRLAMVRELVAAGALGIADSITMPAADARSRAPGPASVD